MMMVKKREITTEDVERTLTALGCQLTDKGRRCVECGSGAALIVIAI